MDKLNVTNETGLSASGSATGNPRNKVALKPGHSLMDWIRLTNSGEDLTGFKGVVQTVTLQQLAEHNSVTDCWLAIRGTVFNVTRYLEFHPGGRDQLMRGVGKDATILFDEVHAYVNYASLLQKCIVGHLSVPEKPRTNPEPAYPPITPSSTKPEPEFKSPAPPSASVLLPLDWYQTEDTIHIVFYTKIPEPRVTVQLLNQKLSVLLTLCTRHVESRCTLHDGVQWPCKITISDIGKVDIEFVKVERRQWSSYGSPCHGTLVKSDDEKLIQRLIVKGMYKVSHDTELIVLRHETQCYKVIPVGQHIVVHFNDDGEELTRMYTPVPPCLPHTQPMLAWSPDCVCLMVKHYPAGAVSPRLHALSTGDIVQYSGPLGPFSTVPLKYCSRLHLIAAGTGVTPMFGLIQWALEDNRKRCKHVRLLFFNRTSKDLLWADQLDDLAKADERFSVQHVLSEPESNWQGVQGRITASLLGTFLADADSESDQDFSCVCGPTLFTQATREMIVGLGFSGNQFHCFVG